MAAQELRQDGLGPEPVVPEGVSAELGQSVAVLSLMGLPELGLPELGLPEMGLIGAQGWPEEQVPAQAGAWERL